MIRSCLFVAVGLLLVAGCSSGPGRVETPEIDPAAAAAAAIKQYDQNGDGQLSEKEVETSALSVETWDTDKSGTISEAEIAERLQRYLDSGVGLISVTAQVVMNGFGVEGATVTFEPEKFLGDALHSASGITDTNGYATVALAEEHRPNPALNLVESGLYTVKITHPTQSINKKFNTETTLAYDVSPIDDIENPVFRVTR